MSTVFLDEVENCATALAGHRAAILFTSSLPAFFRLYPLYNRHSVIQKNKLELNKIAVRWLTKAVAQQFYLIGICLVI